MLTVKLNYKNEEIVIPTSQDDNVLIHIYDHNNVGFLHASSFDQRDSINNLWLDSVPINIGDVLELEIAEMNEVSQPRETIKIEKSATKSKLENFLELENSLKQRGLL